MAATRKHAFATPPRTLIAPVESRMRDRGFVAYVLELLEPLDGCSARAMFGGHGVYRDGGIFGLVIDDRLYLKADAQSEAAFAAAGSAPFVYQGKGRAVQMSYWSLPEDALDNSEEMIRWARLALAAAARKLAVRKVAVRKVAAKPRKRNKR